MALISTSTHTQSNVFKHEYQGAHNFINEVVVVNDTAGTLAIGTVVGRVTATGKYKRCVQTASDGSQNAAGIVHEAKTILDATDANVVVTVRGPVQVSKNGLVLDASYDLAAEKQAVYDQLGALGIQCLDTLA